MAQDPFFNRKPGSSANGWAEQMGEIRVPAAKLFSHPTLLSNIYSASIETVLLDPETVPGATANLRIEHRTTKSLHGYRDVGRRAGARTWIERVSAGSERDFHERLVYDARWTDNANVAHIFHRHLAVLGLAKKRLGVGGDDCLILLEKKSARFSHDLFRLAGYETFETNLPVRANLLLVDFDFRAPYHLLPFVATLEPANLNAGLPRKIFISRRGTRRLTNEASIVALLREHGFQTVYFEGMPLAEQWSIARYATSIVAIHGAALGFLATKGAAPLASFELLEFFSPGLVVDCFRKYSAILGGAWTGCRGRLTPEFLRCLEGPAPKAMEGANFELDPRTIERALAAMKETP